MPDPWTIVEDGFDPETSRAYEGLFTQGSGYLHVRGSLEEHLAGAPQNVDYDRRPANTTAERFAATKAKWGTYVPGVFGPHPHLKREMVNLPWPLDLVPTVDGERLDVETSRIELYRRTLRLRDARLVRTLTWATKSGPRIKVAFERFASAARPHFLLQRMTLASDREVSVTVSGGIDADVRTNGHDHFTAVSASPDGTDGVRCVVRTDGGDEVTMLSRLACDGALWTAETGPRAARRIATRTVSAGGSVTVEKRTAVVTSRDLEPIRPEQVLAEAAGKTWDTLLAEHAAVWEARWEASDVVIEGDPASQAAIRASVYHLLRTPARGDPRVAVGAKGFAGEAYRGQFFWDTEMYLIPFHLYTHPPAARPLAEFRIRTLPAARALATRFGYPGARYPWQTDTRGEECGAQWQYTDLEVHVTAAVAYGLAHLAAATGDAGFLDGPAAEVLAETARYWMDRLDVRPGEDRPSLLGVMGPDEYTPLVSNNAYTNRLVAFALALAARHGGAAGATEEERAAWAAAAEALPVRPGPDGLVLQCVEWPRLAEPDFDRFWTDRSQPFARFVSRERLYRTRCLKQADVLMLMMLFPDEFTDAEVGKAWDTYLPVTTHDSSLSASIHAIVALRLGRVETAYDFWRASAFQDLDVAGGGAAEGVHIAGCGGNWQVCVLGFAGMRTALQADRLTLRPHLPPAWTRLAFPVVWRDTRVHVEVTREETTVANRGTEALEVEVNGIRKAVAPAASETFAP